ncbi:protein Wiz-like isoform X1 [Hippocampus zosterae]|uniref:protein Wiz-like isoform X1 n=1 Tax=Hippocampus zosterae TaxID=109293 RepID=UPI00223E30E9|nr:protein Wiz-like isoform X1 [Hippocampus zosterae]XP_051940912.1 protein Wiz-like isoform X1 [Hippocampus zosterae]XP_051940913.1 protein Wiz-like isoform X1 [Hippocampus zosterae]
MATSEETDQQGSPTQTSTVFVPDAFPSDFTQQLGRALSSSEHPPTAKPFWAPLETDAPVTLASNNNNNNDEVHICQLCSSWYETRKGLCSHARSHLQQMGIPDIDIKGDPIDFLYQIMNDRDLKSTKKQQQEPLPTNSRLGTPTKRPSGLSPPPTSPPCKRPKPPDEFTCILCGEVCKNRKGLASHSRSHLRQIGVLDLLGKDESAIGTVQELVSSGVLEAARPLKMNSITSSFAAPSSAPTSPLASQPLSSVTEQCRPSFPSTSSSLAKSPQSPVNRAPKAKKGFRLAVDPLLRMPKPEPLEVDVSLVSGASSSSASTPPLNLSAPATPSKALSADEPAPPTVLCDYCGQLFETRKALSCHARAHLRQLGLTWSIKTSPIDLLNDIMMRGDDRFLSNEVSSSGKIQGSPQGSKRTSESSQQAISNLCSSPLDYSIKDKSPSCKSETLTLGKSCELCGYTFENRKALASHARAHLRQLGVLEWKSEGATSPIEHLRELMRKDPVKVAAVTRRYREGDFNIKKKIVSLSTLSDSESLPGNNLKFTGHKLGKDDQGVSAGSSKQTQGHIDSVAVCGSTGVRSPRGEQTTER